MSKAPELNVEPFQRGALVYPQPVAFACGRMLRAQQPQERIDACLKAAEVLCRYLAALSLSSLRRRKSEALPDNVRRFKGNLSLGHFWVRQTLKDKPQSRQNLQPRFIRELQAWAKHEETVELQDILEQNFLRYEGKGPVPSQIHSYLCSQYKNLRGLEKHDSGLVAKARGRWYVPDPAKAGDLEKLRAKSLLKDFEIYKSAKKKLKQFRTEAVGAGFKAAYDEQDYDTIVAVAEKIPDKVLQEDEKLLMYYDVALMHRG